jgi:hypothetical protein
MGYNFETVTFLGHARLRKTDKLGGFARGSIEKIYHWRLYVKPLQTHGFSVDRKGFAHNLQ